MTHNQLDNIRQEIDNLLDQLRLGEAFEVINKIIDESGNWNLHEELDCLKLSYDFMLRYLAQGVLDPKRDEVLTSIVNGLHSIKDRCLIEILEKDSHEVFFVRRRELKNIPLIATIETLKNSYKKYVLINSMPKEQRSLSSIIEILKEVESDETHLFNKIWSEYPLKRDNADAIRETLNKDLIPTHSKALILSALFLGLMKYYDEEKLLVLMENYTNCSDAECQLRSLIYVLLTLYLYERRAKVSKTVSERASTMRECPNYKLDITSAQLLLIRSRNTDNISRKVRDELMPKIMDMPQDLLSKIKGKDATFDMADIEANPEWSEMLNKSGFIDKMEELNELQQNGSDVFISTFARLKSFPFFQTLSNWFLPYHTDHSLVMSTFDPQDIGIGRTVLDAPFLCNSDKYSFCLSISSLPYSQRQMMMGQISENNKDYAEQEMEDCESNKKREQIINRHVQDLYRFFKLFSRRREFANAFDLDMDFCNIPFLGKDISNYDTMTSIANFYLKNEFYDDAIKYFKNILNSNNPNTSQIYQKIAYAYHNSGNIKAALQYYKKYELTQENDAWTTKQIASCYRSLKQYDKAIKYYKTACDLNPGSVSNVLNLGHCYLEKGNIEEALNEYFKADFMEDPKHKSWRPIAWCSFLTGNDERALKYYDKIIDLNKQSAQDFLNRGHVLLCSGKITDAIESYRQALALGQDATAFRASLLNDTPQLSARGINPNDIPLLADVICKQ